MVFITTFKVIMKIRVSLVALSCIFIFPPGYTEYRTETLINDAGLDIAKLSDTISDTNNAPIDTTPKYVYIDTPFLQYESRLIDMDTPINSIIEYNGHILFAREDGLLELSSGGPLKIQIHGFENIRRILRFKE